MNDRGHKDCARFWRKVLKGEACWEWFGARDRKGYGKFSIGNSKNPDGSRRNSMVSAHRFSYELHFGAIPSGDGFHGTCVLHRCDNPSCVRPDHLFLGSNMDNVHDMDRKGRRINNQLVGSEHPMAILDENKVGQIHAMRRAGLGGRAIADSFGVSPSTISAIFKGRLWRHVSQE